VDRRRCTAELGDGVGAGALQAPGWHESMPGVTAKQVKGSAGSGAPRRRENRAAESLPAALKFCYGGARQGRWKRVLVALECRGGGAGGVAGFKKGKPGISGGIRARGSPGIAAVSVARASGSGGRRG